MTPTSSRAARSDSSSRCSADSSEQSLASFSTGCWEERVRAKERGGGWREWSELSVTTHASIVQIDVVTTRTRMYMYGHIRDMHTCMRAHMHVCILHTHTYAYTRTHKHTHALSHTGSKLGELGVLMCKRREQTLDLLLRSLQCSMLFIAQQHRLIG